MLLLHLLWLVPAYALTCSPSTKATRREWGVLSPYERLDYINAVQCMINSPSILPTEEYPGVRSRLDDFTAVHINNTLHNHLNGLFLIWHREYLVLWEKALREECAYRGTLPYWDWTQTTTPQEFASSPIFNGSLSSMSGNGSASHNNCVTTGPFANTTITLPGSDSPDFTDPEGSVPSNPYRFSPSCLTRTINTTIFRTSATTAHISNLLAQPDMRTFQFFIEPQMDPVQLDEYEAARAHNSSLLDLGIGPHGAGHVGIGGQILDIFASPRDPLFMLHHAMVDLVWAVWQGKDGGRNRWAVNGTDRWLNSERGETVSLETEMQWGVLGEAKTVREVMDVEGGEYCYGYEVGLERFGL